MNTTFFTTKTCVAIFAVLARFAMMSCAAIPYFFSKEHPDDVNSNQVKGLFKQQVRIQDRELLFFGSLANLFPGVLIEEDIRNLISQEMWQMYQRLGIISQDLTNNWVCRAYLFIQLVAYVQRDQWVTLEFSRLAEGKLSQEYPIPLAFWGEGLDMDGLWDETGNVSEDGNNPEAGKVPEELHVRSLPFGVRLLSSSLPKVHLTENLATTYHFIPASCAKNGNPMIIQTIFWLGMKDYQSPNGSLSAEEFLEVLNQQQSHISNNNSHLLQAVADHIARTFSACLSSFIQNPLKAIIGELEKVENLLKEANWVHFFPQNFHCLFFDLEPFAEAACSLHNLIKGLYNHMDCDTSQKDRVFLKYLFLKHNLTKRLFLVCQQMKELLQMEQRGASSYSIIQYALDIRRVWQKILDVCDGISSRDSGSGTSSGSSSASSGCDSGSDFSSGSL